MNMTKIAILVSLLSCSVFGGWYFRGLKADAEIAELKREHEKNKATALGIALSETIRLNQENNKLVNKIAEIDGIKSEELSNAKLEQNNLRAAIRDRDVRLSVLVRKTTCGRDVSATATDTGMDNGTERAELDGQAAERIVAIANDGDNAIRQLTACQSVLSEFVKARDD